MYSEQQISELTAFDKGDEFESEDQVRKYFTVENVKSMFPNDETSVSQDQLDEMADLVIENGWHMKPRWTSIRIEKRIKDSLDQIKKKGESYQDLIFRLTKEEKIRAINLWCQDHSDKEALYEFSEYPVFNRVRNNEFYYKASQKYAESTIVNFKNIDEAFEYFFNQRIDLEDLIIEYEDDLSSILDKLGIAYIDHSDETFYFEQKLTDSDAKVMERLGIYVIDCCEYLTSDHNFHSPVVKYWAAGGVIVIIGGDDPFYTDERVEELPRYISDHPDRAVKVLKEQGILDEKKEYLIHYDTDNDCIVPERFEILEISRECWAESQPQFSEVKVIECVDGDKKRYFRKTVSRIQGSRDYSTEEIDKEEFDEEFNK